ncbi:zinc ribbon domain-containing protein [Clostridium sp.]|uniref:zinc ribbon domain-containing protein n=1 Tax=Clostridium sp. TaxID=1506 RepID=UPI003D6D6BE9
MFCQYCGTKIQDNEASCSHCNHPVNRSRKESLINNEEIKPTTPVNVAKQNPIKWEMDSPYGEVNDKRAIKQTQKYSRRSIAIGFSVILLILILVLLINNPLNIGSIVKRNTTDPLSITDRPSLETIYTSSPFYSPELNLPSDVGTNHNKNVMNKIDEILKITDKMMGSYSSMKQEIYDNTLKIYVLLKEIDSAHSTHYIENSEALKKLEELVAFFELQELRYYGLEIKKTGEGLYDSDIAFARVASAMTTCEKVTEAYKLQIVFSTNLYETFKEDPSTSIQTLSKGLKDTYQKSNADVYGANLMAGVDTVNEMIMSLDAATALLALSNIEYMENNMEQTKKDVEKLRNSNLVDVEFVELTELMIGEYEKMTALSTGLEAYVDKLDLDMSFQQSKSIFSFLKPLVVKASSDKYSYGAGYNVQMLQKSGQEYMDKQRKAYEEKYKDESYWETAARTAKEFRKGVQEGVENVDAATFEGLRTVAGLITPSLGNGKEDAYKDIQKRYALAQKRIAEGKGGQDVFKTAVDGFDASQKLVGEGWYNIGAFWEDELGLPEDTISQVASGMGTLAAESFTQFGQGLARILDPDAKDSDIAKGCLEVATSMVGGTNNIFSATKTGGAVISKMGKILTSPILHVEGVIDAIKVIKNIGLPKLGSLTYKETAIKGTMAILKKSKQVAGNMIDKLDEAFTKEISGIFTKNWKDSLSGFRDYANKAGSNIDDSAVKLIDEFINGYIDNKVTDLAAHPWLWDPTISDKEKEAKLASEIDNINQEIEQGLEKIQEQIEKKPLNDVTYFNGKWEATIDGVTADFTIRICDDSYATISVVFVSSTTEYIYSQSSQTLELLPLPKKEDEEYDFLGAKFKKTAVNGIDAVQTEGITFKRVR